MSKDMQKTFIIGRLGNDPEMRFTPSGTPVTNFRVAVNESWRDGNGQEREHTEWFSAVAWQQTAEICNQYLKKGSRVHLEGKLRTRSWDDNGTTRYKTELVVSEVIMLDGPSNRPASTGQVDEVDIAPTIESEPEPEPEPAQANGRQARSRQARG